MVDIYIYVRVLLDCPISLNLSSDWSQRPRSFLSDKPKERAQKREGAAEVKHKGKHAAAVCLQQQPGGKERTWLQYHLYLCSSKWFWEVKMAYCLLLLFPCRQISKMCAWAETWKQRYTHSNFKTDKNCIFNCFYDHFKDTVLCTVTDRQNVTAQQMLQNPLPQLPQG